MRFIVCVPVSLCMLVVAYAKDPSIMPATDSILTMTFPADRPVGVVEMSSHHDFEKRNDEEPELVPAFGTVRVASNQFVSLIVGTVDDLRWLDQLPLSGIQRLEIRGQNIDQQAVQRIARFEGLQELRLDGCQIASDAFDQAPTLNRLRRMTISSVDRDKPHLNSLASWISRLPVLDYVYATPAMDAIAIQKIRGHRSLKTITIDVQKDREAIIFKMISDLPSLTGLIVSVDEDVSPRALDRLASLPNLELLTLVRARVDGTLLNNIAQIGTVRNLRFIAVTPGDDFLQGLKSVRSVENLTLNLMPWEDENAEREFQQQLPFTLLDLPNIKDLPDMRGVDEKTLRRIIDMPNVESIHINGLAKGVEVSVLSGLQKLTRLKTLRLTSVPINDDDLKMFSKMNSLQYLSLVHAKVSGTGFSHLKDLPNLIRLQIMMDKRRVKPDLRGIASLTHVTRIHVFGLGFKPQDFFPIADCRSIRRLTLSDGPIDDSVVEQFSRLPELRHVSLPDSSITDQGAAALARLQTLQTLSVTGDISVAGVKEFAKLSNLSSLFVRSSKLSETDKNELPSLFPAVSKIGFRDK